MDWNQLWNDIVTFFETNIWNIVLFFAVLFIGIILIKLLINISRRLLNKTKIEKIAVGFIIAILKVVLYLCLVLILLSIIGVQITGILTALSALILAIGLALENNIANAANGLIVVSSKMFKKGDNIEVDGKKGTVVQINFLFTTILTSDNKRVTIPNSTIINSSVVDCDANKTRRVEWKFTVAYESDVEQVKKLICDCMYSNGKVRLDPAPFCRLNNLGASSIEFVARAWCDREDYWDVYHDVLELVYNELKRNNISIPYDQLEIRQRKDNPVLPINKKPIPKRVEKIRVEQRDFDLENADLTSIFFKKKGKKSTRESERKVDLATNLLKTEEKLQKNSKIPRNLKRKKLKLKNEEK